MSLCECGCGQETRVAKRNRYGRGQIKGRPKRFVQGHGCRKYPQKYEERDNGFDSPCWVWMGRIDDDGYARRHAEGHTTRLIHKQIYEDLHGPVEDGCELDHLCRVRHCVNPDHLEPVTRAENVRRGKTPKLSVEDAAYIRSVYQSHKEHRIAEGFQRVERGFLQTLAKTFDVSRDTVKKVANGEAWVD